MQIKLIYSNIGAAEAMIQAMKIGDLQFQEVKMDMNEFRATGAKGPILEVDGKQYKSSQAALRFIGRANGAWGYPEDPWEAAEYDELLDELANLRKIIAGAAHLGSQDAMLDRRNEIADMELPSLLEKIDDRVEETGEGRVFAKGVSIMDTEVCALATWLLKGTIEGIPNNILDQFNGIVRVQYEIMRHPKIGRNKARAADL